MPGLRDMHLSGLQLWKGKDLTLRYQRQGCKMTVQNAKPFSLRMALNCNIQRINTRKGELPKCRAQQFLWEQRLLMMVPR